MKKGGGEPKAACPAVAKSAKAPRTPKAAKAAPPTPEAVAARLLAFLPLGDLPALWKDAELKRWLPAAERPVLAAALTRLEEARQVLVLTQGKGKVYLFAEPLRGWLANAPVVRVAEAETVPGRTGAPEDLFTVYARLVARSGGFPDVKIAALRAALDTASARTLTGRLVDLWREGRATLSHGDWSLADEETRSGGVELNGERYLLVRLE